MKDHRQKDRQSLANTQYRAFMEVLAEHLADPKMCAWATKESQSGSPLYTSQIDPCDPDVSGYSAYYTHPIHGKIVVCFQLLFQAGIREMCRTEIQCFYGLADSVKDVKVNPHKVPCITVWEEQVVELDDPYLYQIWTSAEKMGIQGKRCIRKQDIATRGRKLKGDRVPESRKFIDAEDKKNFEVLAECAAGFINPMIAVATNACTYVDKKE